MLSKVLLRLLDRLFGRHFDLVGSYAAIRRGITGMAMPHSVCLCSPITLLVMQDFFLCIAASHSLRPFAIWCAAGRIVRERRCGIQSFRYCKPLSRFGYPKRKPLGGIAMYLLGRHKRKGKPAGQPSNGERRTAPDLLVR